MRQIAPHESHRMVAKIVSELFKGQGTRSEIVDRTGLDRNYVSRVIAALKEQGCIYIIQWNRDETGRYQQAVFTFGFGEDVPRPPPQTQSEKDARRYRKMRQAKLTANVKTTFVGRSLWV
jgi:hypothetical protein